MQGPGLGVPAMGGGLEHCPVLALSLPLIHRPAGLYPPVRGYLPNTGPRWAWPWGLQTSQDPRVRCRRHWGGCWQLQPLPELCLQWRKGGSLSCGSSSSNWV